jgi:hypothetical protein
LTVLLNHVRVTTVEGGGGVSEACHTRLDSK